MTLNIIIGFILGLIISYYINAIRYHGPNSRDIKKKIYKSRVTGKCYKMKPKIYVCPLKYQKNKN